MRTAADTAAVVYGKNFVHVPFDFVAKVSYVRQKDWIPTMAFAVEDDHGAVILHKTGRLSLTPRPGDTLRIRGKTARPPSSRPCAFVDDVELISHGPAPSARSSTIQEVHSGKLDCRLTSITGNIRDVSVCEVNPQWAIIVLAGDCGILYAIVPIHGDDFNVLEKLIGLTVALIGVPAPSDHSKRILIGRTFKLADMSSIRVIGEPDTTASPPPDIRGILHLGPDEIAVLGRHRTIGRVLAVWGGNQALVRNDENLVTRIEFDKCKLPVCGQRIEAFGFPESDLFHVNLCRATWKALDETIEIDQAPDSITVEQLFSSRNGNRSISPHFHGSCIRIRGQVLKKPSPDTGSTRLLLDSNGTALAVESIPDVRDFADIEVGTKVEIVGICVMEMENWRPSSRFFQAKGFFVVPRCPTDICVLSTPSWWTPVRFICLIGVLVVVLIAVLLWNTTLRCLAEKRGRELLREQIGRERATLQTEERTRLAVELHDSLAQSLTGVSMELETAKRLSNKGCDVLMPHLERGTRALKSCRDELRNCIWDLRSHALDVKDMNEAILRTLQPFADRLRISIRFNVPREMFSDNLLHGLLRIIRELVINAIRHGEASLVKIAGTVEGDKAVCSVLDNGSGFDPQSTPGVPSGHYGLQGVRERVNQFGGTFELISSPGSGTHARISLTLDKSNDALHSPST
ncbi:MAG: sensor histidine kinase [bacterium]|nr:sensor histidine kinase [Candidatus Colisoma equi]